MTKTNRSALHSVFRGLSKILGGIAGISFIFGGGIIAALGNTSRSTGEFFGIVMAGACFILALLAHGVAEQFDDGEAADDQPSFPAGG